MAILYVLNGAKRVILLDKYKQVYKNLLDLKLYNALLEKYPGKYDKISFNSIDNKIIYLNKTPIEYCAKIPKNSIDFLYSNAVLEHVSNLDLAIGNISRLLKHNAYSFHHIDLKDHYHTPDKCYLDFLKYTNVFWKMIGDTNRTRFSEYLKLFKKHNFKILETNLHVLKTTSILVKIKKHFNRKFRNLEDNDLSVLDFNIIVRGT